MQIETTLFKYHRYPGSFITSPSLGILFVRQSETDAGNFMMLFSNFRCLYGFVQFQLCSLPKDIEIENAKGNEL